jgi:hypothetical protein
MVTAITCSTQSRKMYLKVLEKNHSKEIIGCVSNFRRFRIIFWQGTNIFALSSYREQRSLHLYKKFSTIKLHYNRWKLDVQRDSSRFINYKKENNVKSTEELIFELFKEVILKSLARVCTMMSVSFLMSNASRQFMSTVAKSSAAKPILFNVANFGSASTPGES